MEVASQVAHVEEQSEGVEDTEIFHVAMRFVMFMMSFSVVMFFAMTVMVFFIVSISWHEFVIGERLLIICEKFLIFVYMMMSQVSSDWLRDIERISLVDNCLNISLDF